MPRSGYRSAPTRRVRQARAARHAGRQRADRRRQPRRRRRVALRCAAGAEIAASGWTVPVQGPIVSGFRTAGAPDPQRRRHRRGRNPSTPRPPASSSWPSATPTPDGGVRLRPRRLAHSRLRLVRRHPPRRRHHHPLLPHGRPARTSMSARRWRRSGHRPVRHLRPLVRAAPALRGPPQRRPQQPPAPLTRSLHEPGRRTPGLTPVIENHPPRPVVPGAVPVTRLRGRRVIVGVPVIGFRAKCAPTTRWSRAAAPSSRSQASGTTAGTNFTTVRSVRDARARTDRSSLGRGGAEPAARDPLQALDAPPIRHARRPTVVGRGS